MMFSLKFFDVTVSEAPLRGWPLPTEPGTTSSTIGEPLLRPQPLSAAALSSSATPPVTNFRLNFRLALRFIRRISAPPVRAA